MIYSDIELEKIVYLESLRDPSLFQFIKTEFLEDKNIRNLYKIANAFYKKFKTSPSRAQIKQLVSRKEELRDEISYDLIDTIHEFQGELESLGKEWLDETVQSWVKFKNMQQGLFNAAGLAKISDLNPANIDTIRAKMKEILTESLSVNFNTDIGIDFFNPNDHYSDPADKIPSGKRFLDELTGGGYEKGELIVYVAPPNQGKSQFLANDAAFYVHSGKNVVMISAEMKPKKFLKRIGANLLNVKVKDYDAFAKNPVDVENRLSELSIMGTPGKLRIVQLVDPNILQIEQTVKKIEDVWGQRCDVLIVDYINILSDYRSPNTDKTYTKVKNITKDLRDISVANNWLTITASQTNRSGFENSSIGMDVIAESTGTAMNADIIFSIIRKPDRLDDSEFFLKIIKTRDSGGRDTMCRFSMEWDYLRLVEENDISTTETFF